MTVFQFGVRVAAPEAGSTGRAEPDARPASTKEPLVAPLVLGICADAVVEGGPPTHRALVYFDRDAASLPAAVVTSVLDLEHSGLDCLAVVPDDDLVTLGVIAPRLGLPPGAAGGLLDGPVPAVECGGFRVFRWSDIVAWLRSEPGSAAGPAPAPVPPRPPVFAALNLALRLRRLVRADPALAVAVRDLLTS
jgi:hypothetical protein